jgi:hypothetical protein
MNNGELCVNQHNWMNRMVDSVWTIADDAFEMGKIMTHDDSCYSEEQRIQDMGVLSEYAYSLASTILGFQGEWSN